VFPLSTSNAPFGIYDQRHINKIRKHAGFHPFRPTNTHMSAQV
jgi:hypothetical protein